MIVNPVYPDFMKSVGSIAGNLSSAQLREKKAEMISAIERIARGEEVPKSWFNKICESLLRFLN